MSTIVWERCVACRRPLDGVDLEQLKKYNDGYCRICRQRRKIKRTWVWVAFLAVVMLQLACSLTAEPAPSVQTQFVEIDVAALPTVAAGEAVLFDDPLVNPPNLTPYPTPIPTPTAVFPMLRCTATGSVNVRECGSVQCAVLDWLYVGDMPAVITSTTGVSSWLYIEKGSVRGWVNAEFCQISLRP